MSKHLGSISFSSIPDVNGELLLTNGSGTANQLVVSKASGVINVSFAENLIIPGVEKVRIPVGTTAQRSTTPSFGDTRANSTTGIMEFFNGSAWVPPGAILSVTDVNIPSSSGTTTVPLDNTIPTVSEGYQFFSISYTPLSASSRLIIEYDVTSSSSIASATLIASIFVNSTNIGSVSSRTSATSNTAMIMSQKATYQVTSTSPITISGRIGGSAAATTRVNLIGTTTLGGSMSTSATITEVFGG